MDTDGKNPPFDTRPLVAEYPLHRAAVSYMHFKSLSQRESQNGLIKRTFKSKMKHFENRKILPAVDFVEFF